MKMDEMLTFLLDQENLVDRFLKHIDNPPLMDFLLKVISTDKPDNPTGIVYLLKDQELISKLVEFLDPEVNSSIQSAAGDFIKAFVTISANSNTDNSTIGPNELTRELVSEPIMERLSDLMLCGGTSLANGVGIIIEIIRKNNSDYDFVPVLYITIESHPPNSRDPIYLGHLIKIFQKKIPEFTKLLKNSKTPDLETPFGKIEPLGFERFKICELIAELLHCSNMGLLNDASGEEIVYERDQERKRVIELEKQQQEEFQDDLDLSNEASRNIDRLSITSKNESHNDDADNDSEHEEEAEGVVDNDNDESDNNNNKTPEELSESNLKKVEGGNSEEKDLINNDEETDSTTITASSNDENDDSKQPILESEPDSDDVDATLEIKYDDQELEVRRDPVVGDQLKIALADNQVILIILQMFFKFPWNNFLHNVVFDIVQQILNGSMEIGYNKYLAIDLFGRGDITKLIIDGQQKCEDYEAETSLRLGYMGHLTLIAEEVVKFTALYPPITIHQVILDAISTPEWTIYVTETLVETREKYNALLGGVPQDQDDTTHDEDDEESGKLALDPNVDHDIIGSGADVDYEEDENHKDKFSRFMSQELTNDFPDKFGSSDEDDEDDVLVGWENQQYQSLPRNEDEDEYLDPNDDGQSYTKKNHPLYSDLISPDQERAEYLYGDGDGDDSSSSSSSDEGGDGNYEDDEDKGYTLTRTKSNGEINWTDDN
jgi:SIT4-associating protein SAP185/190